MTTNGFKNSPMRMTGSKFFAKYWGIFKVLLIKGQGNIIVDVMEEERIKLCNTWTATPPNLKFINMTLYQGLGISRLSRVCLGCLDGVLWVSRSCLEGIWRVSGRCLKGVLIMSGLWLLEIWKASGQCQERSSWDGSKGDRSIWERLSWGRSGSGQAKLR